MHEECLELHGKFGKTDHVSSEQCKLLVKNLKNKEGKYVLARKYSCSTDIEMRKLILNELRVLKFVGNHLNIELCYGLFEVGNIPVTVAHHHGDQLQNYRLSRKEDLAVIAVNLMAGIAHIHSKSIIHNALSPACIFIEDLPCLQIRYRSAMV